METIEAVLRDVPLFEGLTPAQLEVIAGCGSNVQFREGELLFKDRDPAERFYVLRHGSVALETFVPARGAVVIETLEAGEVVGWSWLFPPTSGTSTRGRCRSSARRALTASACGANARPTRNWDMT